MALLAACIKQMNAEHTNTESKMIPCVEINNQRQTVKYSTKHLVMSLQPCNGSMVKTVNQVVTILRSQRPLYIAPTLR